MQPSQQQPPGSIQINPQAQYIPHNQFGQQVIYTNTGQQIVVISQAPQNGLISASYICSAIGLLVLGIILGPIGFILALIAKNNGDYRGKSAMIFAAVVTLLSLLVAIVLFNPALA